MRLASARVLVVRAWTRAPPVFRGRGRGEREPPRRRVAEV